MVTNAVAKLVKKHTHNTIDELRLSGRQDAQLDVKRLKRLALPSLLDSPAGGDYYFPAGSSIG